MPRRARIALPHVPLHLIQRGNNRQSCFFADEDYRNYLDWLGQRYIELNPVRAGMVDRIRSATNGNFALGDNRFAEQVAAILGRRVVPGEPGRPMKLPEPGSGSLV